MTNNKPKPTALGGKKLPSTSELFSQLTACLEQAKDLSEELSRRRSVAVPQTAWIFDGAKGLLTGPTGIQIKLSAQAAAVLTVLMQGDHQRGTYSDVLNALKQEGTPGRRKLAMLVSRLRARGARAGIENPIRGGKSRGHIFLDAVTVASSHQ